MGIPEHFVEVKTELTRFANDLVFILGKVIPLESLEVVEKLKSAHAKTIIAECRRDRAQRGADTRKQKAESKV